MNCSIANPTLNIMVGGIGITSVLILILFITKHDRNRVLMYSGSLILHLTLSYVFYVNAVETLKGNDAVRFFDLACIASGWTDSYGIAIDFMVFSVYPLNSILGLSFFTTSLLFSLAGFLGFLLIVDTALQHRPQSVNNYIYKSIIIYLMFSASLHFWLGGITKEAVTLLSIGLLVRSFLTSKVNFIFLFLGLVIMIHVRPYLGVIAISCLAFSSVFKSKNLSLVSVFLIGLPLISLMGFAVDFLAEHLGISSLNFTEIEDRIDTSLSRWSGGSYVDLTAMNPVEKIFTFLFRPLFFDANGIQLIFASIDNLIFMFIATLFIISSIRKKYDLLPNGISIGFCLLFSLALLVLLSFTTPNLGTASRKKVMVVIPLLSYALTIGSRRQFKWKDD